MSHIVGFAVTVAIWPREAVACRDFILVSVATLWVMSLVRIYPCRAEALPGGRGCHVARLNFKTSRVGVNKCLSIIVGVAVTVAIWPREVVAISVYTLSLLFGPGRLSEFTLASFSFWFAPIRTSLCKSISFIGLCHDLRFSCNS